MRKILLLMSTLFAASIFLLLPYAAALPGGSVGMNARFVNWQKLPHVIHIIVYLDAGRPGQPVAEVDVGQPVLFGFEYGAATVEDLQPYIDDPNNDIALSVDGGTSFSVKGFYQSPFEAATRSGPRWSWDHDGDGPGDGDGDGIGDWSDAVLFFRYQSSGLTAGTHTFTFSLTDDGWGSTFLVETITVTAS